MEEEKMLAFPNRIKVLQKLRRQKWPTKKETRHISLDSIHSSSRACLLLVEVPTKRPH